MRSASDAVRTAKILKDSCVNAIYKSWKDSLEKILDNKQAEEDLINEGFVAIPVTCKESLESTLKRIQKNNSFTNETMEKFLKEAFKKVRETLKEAGWKIDDDVTKLYPIPEPNDKTE